MNKNAIGLDVGTGSVKVATVDGMFQFPSVVARGKDMELESTERVLVGDDAVRQESVKSMVLRTPVYRGRPASSMDDYLELVGHALDVILTAKKGCVHTGPKLRSDCVIVAGIPYDAADQKDRITDAVTQRFTPKFFGLMYQAKATLDNEGLDCGIVCHIGHGTTEIILVSNGLTADGQTIPRGVGDITKVISPGSKTDYLNPSLFVKNTVVLAQQRSILASHIADALEKVVMDNPGIPVVCAGGGALIPRLVSEIKNDVITNVIVATNPVFSNALGMLKKASRHASD